MRTAAERKDCPKGRGYPLDLHEKNLSSLHNPKILCIFATTDSATLPIRTANQGGTSFLYTFMNYTKQPLDYHQIIAQLKSRGLLFHNEDVAISQLQIISYFRIANYLKSFEVVGFNHVFLPNSYFEDALDLYYFDKKLRNLLFSAIQSIEVALRSKVIHNVSLRHGAFWFTDIRLATNHAMFQDNLTQIKKEVRRSKEEFIQEHFEKYDSPDVPPVWKTLEVTSFGLLSKLFCNLSDNKVKKQIARELNLPQHLCLESWVKCFVVLRNCIAHHARVWNRRFPQIPQLNVNLRGKWISTTHVRPNKLYAIICCLAYLQDAIHSNNDFKQQIQNLLEQYPNVNLHHMGFPRNWQDEPLWK